MGPAITVADFVPLNLCGNHGDNSVLPGPKTSELHAMYSSRCKAPTGDPMKPIYLAERVMLASPNSEPFIRCPRASRRTKEHPISVPCRCAAEHPEPTKRAVRGEPPGHQERAEVHQTPGGWQRAMKPKRKRAPGKLTLSRRAATILLPD